MANIMYRLSVSKHVQKNSPITTVSMHKIQVYLEFFTYCILFQSGWNTQNKITSFKISPLSEINA